MRQCMLVHCLCVRDSSEKSGHKAHESGIGLQSCKSENMKKCSFEINAWVWDQNMNELWIWNQNIEKLNK